MAELNFERMAKNVALAALTEILIDGKPILEWIELLKEWKTPVRPERSGHDVTWWYACGACGAPMDPGDAYCRRCGKAVKWE